MKKRAWLCGLSSLVALSVLGCGDDGDGGGGSYSSGVSPSKQGEDVTQEEAEKFCETFYDYRTSHQVSKATQCKAQGIGTARAAARAVTTLSDEQLQEACSNVEDPCLEEVDEPAAPPDCSDAMAPIACTSTVAEIETCVTDATSQSVAEANGLPSCASVTRDDLEVEVTVVPASCETVQDNCAGLLLRLGIIF